jgi:hypothetical protein
MVRQSRSTYLHTYILTCLFFLIEKDKVVDMSCGKRPSVTCQSCDTFVAMGDVTSGGNVIFGKNSDRPHGEVQVPMLSFC